LTAGGRTTIEEPKKRFGLADHRLKHRNEVRGILGAVSRFVRIAAVVGFKP
jgi:hypothetical protein